MQERCHAHTRVQCVHMTGTFPVQPREIQNYQNLKHENKNLGTRML